MHLHSPRNRCCRPRSNTRRSPRHIRRRTQSSNIRRSLKLIKVFLHILQWLKTVEIRKVPK